jgi:2',3'-cyclic-nucleotide 2'-phosphodiesterase (5'-nucleotidase family)
MNRRMIIMALFLILGSPIQLVIHLDTAPLQSSTIDITIAYTHDLHSHLYSEWTGTKCEAGMPLLSSKMQELRLLRPVLLLDCGDTISGSPVNDFNNGIPMIEVMNAIGYNAMTIDNHEFDPGVPALKEMIDVANFDMLSANVDWPGNPKPLSYSIQTIAGYDIGIVGLTPSFWYSPPESVFDDMVTAANSAVTDLEALGVNFIILLGALPSSLASSVNDIDLIVKGDSLQTIGNTLILPSVGDYASYLGVLDLTIDTTEGTIQSYSFSSQKLTSPLVPDEDIVTIIDSWNEPLAGTLDTPVAYFGTKHSKDDMGLLLAESIHEKTGADVGIYNYGGVRSSINQGFVTYRKLYQVEPFFNYVATLEVKGSVMNTIIGSNYAVTSISTFNPSTWYKVVSSNFTITELVRTYTTNTRNRQDYRSEIVVQVLAQFLGTGYHTSVDDIFASIDACKSSVAALPDSFLSGGTPFLLRSQINDELQSARIALLEEDEASVVDYLQKSKEMIGVHLTVSCPLRWLHTNIDNIIYSLSGLLPPSTTTTTTTTTVTTTNPTTSSPPSTNPENPSIFSSSWTPVVVVESMIIVVALIYYIAHQKTKGNLHR